MICVKIGLLARIQITQKSLDQSQLRGSAFFENMSQIADFTRGLYFPRIFFLLYSSTRCAYGLIRDKPTKISLRDLFGRRLAEK